jgi:hypothetical protein
MPPTPLIRRNGPELTYQLQSQRLQKESSSASADQPNLVESLRAYLPNAERNIERARPILRTRKGPSNKHYKTKKLNWHTFAAGVQTLNWKGVRGNPVVTSASSKKMLWLKEDDTLNAPRLSGPSEATFCAAAFAYKKMMGTPRNTLQKFTEKILAYYA